MLALAQAYAPGERYAICERSMGAIAGEQATIQYADKVSKLILIAPDLVPGGGLPPLFWEAARAIESFGAWPVVAAYCLW